MGFFLSRGSGRSPSRSKAGPLTRLGLTCHQWRRACASEYRSAAGWPRSRKIETPLLRFRTSADPRRYRQPRHFGLMSSPRESPTLPPDRTRSLKWRLSCRSSPGSQLGARRNSSHAAACCALQSVRTSCSAVGCVADADRSLMSLACRLESCDRTVSAVLLSRSHCVVACTRPCGIPGPTVAWDY